MEKSLRKLFYKIVIFDLLILFVLFELSDIFMMNFKHKIATQLTEAFRTQLIIGDTREVILNISKPLFNDFSGVYWRQKNNESNSFYLPEGFNNPSKLIHKTIIIKLFFDENKKYEFGKLYFYYKRWTILPMVLLSWSIIVIISILIGYFEKKRIIKEYNLELNSKISESLFLLSAQVAHDIRSPLAALDSSLNDISQLPEEKRIIIRNAINRIRDIANNLLEKYRYNSNEKFDFDNNQTKNLKTCLISTLIDQVITEKRLQYKTKPEINIDFELTNNSYGLFSNIDLVEFKRIISNLVNNSVEAIPYDKGNIKVILSSEDEYVIVKVKDDGRGIPPEILSRLGEKGLTFNKKGGSGLGLYHSKTTLERWSGKLEINSELNKGTEIIIKIPKAKTPDALDHNFCP